MSKLTDGDLDAWLELGFWIIFLVIADLAIIFYIFR